MNFKKCISLILAVLLLVSNTGLAFNVHYCGDKIASISSVYTTGRVCEMEKPVVIKPCCAKKIAEQHKKCCKDKVVNFKEKTDQGIVKTFSIQINKPFLIHVWKPILFEAVIISDKVTVIRHYSEANSPPLFKLYSQYIFYA